VWFSQNSDLSQQACAVVSGYAKERQWLPFLAKRMSCYLIHTVRSLSFVIQLSPLISSSAHPYLLLLYYKLKYGPNDTFAHPYIWFLPNTCLGISSYYLAPWLLTVPLISVPKYLQFAT